MKKHIANIITGSRIVFSLPLLFIPLTSAWFYALYPPHTVLNKVTGLLLFLLPVTISFVDLTYTLPIVCTIATVAAMHEWYYMEKKHDT